MSEVMVQEASAESVPEARSTREQIVCQRCGSEKVHRVFREGFLQERILPLFGYYPWRCKNCGNLEMLRKRRRFRIRGGEAGRRGRIHLAETHARK
jgi:ssDNA-binding Zn-finger/Zn-ribbon topoisomerase 1